MPTDAGWMTTAEAAEALGLSQGTIKQVIRSGKLKVVRVSRLNFVTPEALEEYRREHAGRQGWDRRKDPDYQPDPVRKARRLRQRAREASTAGEAAQTTETPATEKESK